MVTLLACANRDPRAFNNTGRLDLIRFDGHAPTSRHLAFRLSRRYCPAPLATLEVETVLEGISARVPSIELVDDNLP